ncbi:MAG: acyl-CoA dehydrogenase family protein [Deltaproteobacteria bacterium]|nr:acyl-CoA dehydrogenase family protein [Deltaproteobacteria bacterium]
MVHEEYYKLLDPKFKYTRAFCTEDEIQMAETMRQFVNKEIMPHRQDLEGGWHRDEELAVETQHELYAKLVDLGVTKSNLPETYGGLGLSPVVRQMVNEELSRGDIGLATMVGKIHWIVSFMLAAKRDDLLKEFAPRIVGDQSYTACVAITEPAGGANLEDPAQEFRTIRTIAKEDGGDWVINGHKIWPGPSGPLERFQSKHMEGHLGYWTVCTTDPSLGPEGVALIHIPPDAKGMEFSKPYEKMGFCWSDDNVDIYLDNVRVPKRYRIDTEPGQGAHIVKAYVIGLGRLAGAARLTGLSQAALEIVLNSAKHREIVGQPMRERSLFANHLAEMFRYIELARQYYLSVTWQVMHPEIYGAHWTPEMIAKYSAARSFAADCAKFVCNLGMEMMGSYGYAYEFNLEKYMRDYKITQMWLGGAQRDRLDIAQGLFGPFKWGGFEAFEKTLEPSN